MDSQFMFRWIALRNQADNTYININGKVEMSHQDASSNNTSHVFDFIRQTVLSIGILSSVGGFKIREEQKDVAEDGH